MPSTNLSDRVINMDFDQPCHSVISEEDLKDHIIRLIMINQYFLKKGVELFGEYSKSATTREHF